MNLEKSEIPRTRFVDFTDRQFGRLKIETLAGYYIQACGNRRYFWNATCDCGSQVLVGHNEIKRGETTSCGCFQKESVRERSIKHSSSNTPEYRSWRAMKQRCLYEKHFAYKNYGGRGILVCERWLNSFENFLADMGSRPHDTTLDRIDNDGNYEPSNCRWATRSEQQKNQRKRARRVDGTFEAAA